jgi:hypothetical protein
MFSMLVGKRSNVSFPAFPEQRDAALQQGDRKPDESPDDVRIQCCQKLLRCGVAMNDALDVRLDGRTPSLDQGALIGSILISIGTLLMFRKKRSPLW